VSQNFITLIIGRAIAGIGGAAIMVAGMSIIAVVIELKKRPMFFGWVIWLLHHTLSDSINSLFGVIFVLGSCLGPIIGGSFTTSVSWRWCFFVSLASIRALHIPIPIPLARVPLNIPT
jgi:MFS family permease